MKLWGGRFAAKADDAAHSFNSSILFDSRLWRHDITGSVAHAEMLGRQGIIPPEDAEKIVAGLEKIFAEIEGGELEIDAGAEDIHSFIEAELVSRIGDAGRRLHAARSRNDQVALDMRMYVKEEIDGVRRLIFDLLEVLLAASKKHTRTIMPGFTHLQKAQPITLAHHLLAYFQMLRRDAERLADCRARADIMPLGSGALATSTYPIDREFVREKLEFATISQNSLDAVSDRDFCVEFLSALSILMMHLSRFCEEIILWSTEEFNFITVSDAYSTGSSIMPQKKNPDIAELVRGKTGRVFGSLTTLFTVMKGLPLAYNKDMQEDKEAVFDAADTAKACLSVFCAMLREVEFNGAAMRKSAGGGFTNATDAADWLVKKGLPFREAHEIVGRLVLYAIENDLRLEEISLRELREISDVFDKSLFDAISLEACVNGRDAPGGPAESAVVAAIESAEEFLKDR